MKKTLLMTLSLMMAVVFLDGMFWGMCWLVGEPFSVWGWFNLLSVVKHERTLPMDYLIQAYFIFLGIGFPILIAAACYYGFSEEK